MNELDRKEIIEFINKNNYGICYEDYSFKMITTLKVGGLIKIMYYPNCDESLIAVIKYLKERNIPYFIIGNGSNILASDDEYNGVVISLKRIANQFIIEKENEKYKVIVNSGCSVKKFNEFLVDYSLKGFEAISSIPATIGGIVTMNASCYDFVTSNYVRRVQVIKNNNIVWIDNKDLEFSYRNSKILKEKLIVLKIEFEFEKDDKNKINERIEHYYQKRKNTQPINLKSAGSTFKNNEYLKAWEIITYLGLKGYRIGDAMVSNHHANFLVNIGNAKSIDFYNLIEYIKNKAKNVLNEELKTEWILINF